MKAHPYVYKCVHRETNQFYIGYRCANRFPANEDIGIIYKTSSKKIKAEPEKFIFTVIAEFFSPEDAYQFEQECIHESLGDPLLLNRSCFYNKKPFYSMDKETRAKIGIKSLGRDNGRKGKLKSPEELAKLSASAKKFAKSAAYVNPATLPHVRKQISERQTERWKTAPLIQCPHCECSSKVKGNMTRHHFDNCKKKMLPL
jgi:hypothetical protein